MGPLSFSPSFGARSQDRLHLVPKDMSVGPELSSTTSEDDFGIGSTFLPGFQRSRKRTLGCAVCYYLWISEKGTVFQPRHSTINRGLQFSDGIFRSPISMNVFPSCLIESEIWHWKPHDKLLNRQTRQAVPQPVHG